MTFFDKIQKDWLLWASLSLFLVVALPVVWLGMYNHPYVEDDYCFAYMNQDYGFWKAQWYYYTGWNGRYFSNFIYHAIPLAYNNLVFFKFLPVIILGIYWHSLYFLFSRIYFEREHKNAIVFATLVLVYYILFSNTWFESFFWYTSVFIYPLSLTMLNYFFGLMKGENANARLILQVGLTVCLVGSNEIVMFLLCGLLFAYIIHELIFNKRLDYKILFFFLLSVGLGYFVVIGAPGNRIRLNGKGIFDSFDFHQVMKTVFSILTFLPKWVGLTVPLLIIFCQLPKAKIKINILYSSVVFIVGLFGCFLTIHFGNAEGIPPRIESTILGLFLMGLLFIGSQITIRKNTYLHTACFFIICILGLVFSKNLRNGYSDIKSGRAERFDQQMNARYAEIKNANTDTLYLKPIIDVPRSFSKTDIGTDPKHLWNVCYAKYFNKNVIVLTKE